MSNQTKCLKDIKCNKEYIKCNSKNKKKTNYYDSQRIWGCQNDVINKYFPPKRSRKNNPKNSDCHTKCFSQKKGTSKQAFKELSVCRKNCNNIHPKYLIYNYGKLVDKKGSKKQNTIKKTKPKKIKSKSWFW